MKKLLFILILFSACQKEDITNPEKSGKLHAVTFDLSGFTQEIEAMASHTKSDKPLTKSVDNFESQSITLRKLELNYIVYDGETGKIVKHQRSDYEDGENEDYGKFTDSLPAGKYDIVFLMYHNFRWRGVEDDDPDYMKPSVRLSGDFNTATVGLETGTTGGGAFELGTPELFFKHLKLEVSGDIMMDDITLPRVVGGIEIRLTDESFPDNLGTIRTSQKGLIRFPFNHESDYSLQQTYHYLSQNPSGSYMTDYILPDLTTGKLTTDVEIIAFAGLEGGDTLARKVIKDVQIEVNKKTILTGKLFDEEGFAQAFTVNVATDWAGDTEHEF